MEEIVLKNKKHGMITLLVCIAVEILALVGVILCAIQMEKGAAYEEIFKAVTDSFEVTEQEARSDLDEFIEELRKQDLLSE